jgi:hypothetical protein
VTVCGLSGRYAIDVFAGPALRLRGTAYVVGGLYGNSEALAAIEALAEAERCTGKTVEVIFNGDHNWLNVDNASFAAINQSVLARRIVIAGNVEVELGGGLDQGCGCAYPEHFDDGYVARSNGIISRLHATAQQFPEICERLASLPTTGVVQLGDVRIGVVHGDATSLAGWDFAADRLGSVARNCHGDATDAAQTPMSAIAQWFRGAGVDVFASSHTCLPVLASFVIDGQPRVIVNNGSAGMPNFRGTQYGVVTRFSEDGPAPFGRLYGRQLRGVHIDAVAVHYDHGQWRRRFVDNWPEGSDAAVAYAQRYSDGPDYALSDAVVNRITPL